jgi:hypothetical protein
MHCSLRILQLRSRTKGSGVERGGRNFQQASTKHQRPRDGPPQCRPTYFPIQAQQKTYGTLRI